MTSRVEDGIQRVIVAYLRVMLPHGFIVQSTANKPRSRVAGAIEKSMGAVAGWPDIAIYGQHLCAPRTWFVEVKAEGGRLSPIQREVHDALRDIGFDVGVARSIEDARELCREWNLPSLEARAAA